MVLLASQYDQSRFWKAADIAADKKCKIKNVTEEFVGMGKDKEQKLVVWFTNSEKGLVLNRVNNRVIRAAFGDAVDGWTGKIIVIFPTMAEFRGEMKPCLRVKLPAPKSPPPKPEPKPATDPDLDDDLDGGAFADLDDEVGF